MTTDKFEWTDELAAEYGQFFHAAFDNPAKNLGKCMLTEFKLSKLRLPILVTEDGKNIFEGDAVACLNIQTWEFSSYIAKEDVNRPLIYKYFSSNNPRLDYVIENKPCLSLKEVKASVHLSAVEEQQLVELIKIKINVKQ